MSWTNMLSLWNRIKYRCISQKKYPVFAIHSSGNVTHNELTSFNIEIIPLKLVPLANERVAAA